MCLLRDLTAQLPLDRDELLDVWVRPQQLGCLGLERREGLPWKAAVAVELLEEELSAGDGGLGDREVAPGDDALQTLGLWEDGRVRERRDGELEELRACVL